MANFRRNLMKEVKEKEEIKEKQSTELIKNLAELNILNKELRSLNHHYFDINKKFEIIFRRYMQKYGRTKLNNSDLNTFAKLIKDKKNVDYSAKVNQELGMPFLKFMRSNFTTLKNEELKFYAVLKNMKEKVSKGKNYGDSKSLPDEDDGEEDDEDGSADDQEDSFVDSVDDPADKKDQDPVKEGHKISRSGSPAEKGLSNDAPGNLAEEQKEPEKGEAGPTEGLEKPGSEERVGEGIPPVAEKTVEEGVSPVQE
jgi:hypothetical protein